MKGEPLRSPFALNQGSDRKIRKKACVPQDPPNRKDATTRAQAFLLRKEGEPFAGAPFALNQGSDRKIRKKACVPQDPPNRKDANRRLFYLVGLQGLEPWTNRL